MPTFVSLRTLIGVAAPSGINPAEEPLDWWRRPSDVPFRAALVVVLLAQWERGFGQLARAPGVSEG